MNFSASELLTVLERQLPDGVRGLVVALSGGADSCALLAALAQLRDSVSGPGLVTGAAGLVPPAAEFALRAVHVDHGLQEAAAQFRDLCREQCETFGVPLSILAVPVATPVGASIEAVARDARYAALGADLAPGECLLTAHHCDDQAETLLLQAMRGSGLKGLASMPALRPWSAGWHLRPLLRWRRADLRAYVAALGCGTADDPMNADLRFDRVYLRRELWPRIETRWPGATQALARTAVHAAEAQELLDEIADADLVAMRDGEALRLSRLRGLAPARRVNALRRWLRERTSTLPSTTRLTEALRQMLDADGDHLPAISWDRCTLRRYRDRIFLCAAEPPRLGAPLAWVWREQPVLCLGEDLGSLQLVARSGGLRREKLPLRLSVRARAGGEVLKPASRAATRSVQHLCQDLGVLPWMRDALPFICSGGDVVGIADLWLDARWCVPSGDPGLAFQWLGGPNLV